MVEERVSRLEGVVQETSERFGVFERGLEGVRSEMADLRTEMRSEMGALRTEMGSEMGALRTEMRSEVGALRSEMADLRRGTRSEVESLRAEMRDLRVEMKSNFRWTLGIVFGMWFTVVGTLVATILAG